MSISDKVGIVTGGIGGIGFVTVQHLLRNKAEFVAIFDIRKLDSPLVIDSLKILEKEFGKGKFEYYTCDVASVQDFTACYEKVIEQKGYVDILINNAAVANDKDIDLTIDVNFKAVLHGTMIAVHRMGTHNKHKGGIVVNIGSNLGLVNKSMAPVYNATKHAVVSFVRSMKEHNKTFGVRILCLCPGLTKTNMIDNDDFRKNRFDFIPKTSIDEALSFYTQKPDNVAAAIVEIIKKGKAGDVWLAQNDEPPFAVGDIDDVEEMRIPC